MTRRVVILRDTCSPLRYLRCAEPCRPEGWCMDMPEGPGCYLGGSLSEDGARKLAEMAGYSVAFSLSSGAISSPDGRMNEGRSALGTRDGPLTTKQEGASNG